jgi:tetratricopeptide (TPR) repeat protein
MGLDLDHVQSDRSHYATFVCKICNGLADMNAMVTGKCSHPFCKSCIDDWLTKSTGCPVCNLPLEGTSSEEKGSTSRKVPSSNGITHLQSSQPLAFACLSRIKVCCPRCTTWKGEYGHLQEHVKVHHSARDSATHEQGRRPASRRTSEVIRSRSTSDSPAVRRHSSVSTASDSRKVDHRRSLVVGLAINETEESLSWPDDSQGREPGIEGDVQSQRPRRKGRSPAPNAGQNKSALSEASILKEKGNAKFNRGEYVEAKGFYDQALAAVKDIKFASDEERIAVASLYCNRGATYAKERLTDEAIRDYDSAIRIAPEFPKAYARKCKVLATKGRLAEAKVLLETAVMKIPGDKTLLDELKNANRILEAMETITKMLQLRQYVEACNAGTALLRTTDNIEAILLSAEADASTGLIESALEKGEFVLKGDPASVIGLRTKGCVSFLAGNIEVASSMLKETLSMDPNDNKAKELIRVHRKVQNDLNKARAASADGSRGMIKKAVEHFTSAIDEESIPPLCPLMITLRTERAEAALQLMHYSGALSDARAVIDASPRSVQAWVIKANSLIAAGRAHEARSELKGVRHSWARNLPEIEGAYKRADMEAKIDDADKELRAMISSPSTGRRSEEPQVDRFSISDHHDNHRASGPNIRMTRRPSYEAGKTDKNLMNPGKPSRRYTEIYPRRGSAMSGGSAERDTSEDTDRRRMSYGDLPISRESIGADRGTGSEKSDIIRTSSREPRLDSKNTNPRGESATRQSIKRQSVNEDDLRRRISML